jgi:hypothetical protein
MQHVRQLPARRAVSVRGSLKFAWERFSAIAREVQPLFRLHYREIALDQDIVPLAPDWDNYYAMELGGALHVLTARDHKDRLAGYIFNLVGPHQHYVTTRCAHSEMFYLHPHFRKGWQPVKMFVENMRGLKDREAVIHTVNFKMTYMGGRVGKLFQRLGYAPTDIVMRKVL